MELKILFLILFATCFAATCSHRVSSECPCGGDRSPTIDSAYPANVLQQKIARYVTIPVPFRPAMLSAREVQAVHLLVKASRIMDDLFWRQSSSLGLILRDRLQKPKNDIERGLAHYLSINRGPYDRLDDLAPFFKNLPPKEIGATFYPKDMAKEEFENWLSVHPKDREAFQSNFTLIKRSGEELVAAPYSGEYKLDTAGKLLQEAADLVENGSLAKYLRSRADAFHSNDYMQSDMDWMDIKDSALEVTIGPYEVYEDRLFNFKASFESFITVRDPEESKKIQRLIEYLPQMEKALPYHTPAGEETRGMESPLVVVDLIYSAGDPRAGIHTVAFNLPNDERVRAKKGSKKVMLKNVSRAKFDAILSKIADRVLANELRPLVKFDAFFQHTLMHEISHGMGPGFIQKNGEKTTVNNLLKELYTPIEEAKADVLGVFNTGFLVQRGDLSEIALRETYVTFLAGIFRTVRFGAQEAHGLANVLILNYLLDAGACQFDKANDMLRADLALMPRAFESLARELLTLEADGDYVKAKSFLEKYGVVRSELKSSLEKLNDIPVDVELQFELDRLVES
jgi:hypothetical protein